MALDHDLEEETEIELNKRLQFSRGSVGLQVLTRYKFYCESKDIPPWPITPLRVALYIQYTATTPEDGKGEVTISASALAAQMHILDVIRAMTAELWLGVVPRALAPLKEHPLIQDITKVIAEIWNWEKAAKDKNSRDLQRAQRRLREGRYREDSPPPASALQAPYKLPSAIFGGIPGYARRISAGQFRPVSSARGGEELAEDEEIDELEDELDELDDDEDEQDAQLEASRSSEPASRGTSPPLAANSLESDAMLLCSLRPGCEFGLATLKSIS